MKKEYKIHFIYIIGILLAIIIILTTINWGYIPKLVELISFSLTLTSLVLAVLAIGYAVYTNNSSKDSLTKLKEASEKISTTSSTLTTITTSLHRSVEDIPDILKNVEKKSDETQGLLKKILNKPEKNEQAKEATKNSNKEINIEGLLKANSITGLMILAVLKYAYETGRDISFRRINDKLKISDYSYIQGYLIPLSALNIFSYEEIINDDSYDWRITAINTKLLEEIEDQILERDKELKSDNFDLNLDTTLEAIKEYFK